ncbi:MAG: hypothetical protein AUJ96_04590 [Armatimonadetes bacterium CG2_30_66_41]|nr:MAG: hypothetical protein AUJ96_04590 [Armatimonadetes bacterium CG2_30_66_41]
MADEHPAEHGAYVLTLVVAAVAPLVAGKFDFPPQAALYLLIALAAVATALSRRTAGGSASGMPVLLLWLLAAWTAVSWIGSVYRHATELELAKLVILAAWAGLAARFCSDARRCEGWLIALCAGGGIAAWIGIAQYAATPDRNWRTFSTFYNPNELATCLVVAAFCAAGLAFGSDHRPVRLFALTSGISCLGCLLLTGSRGGGAAFLAGSLVLGLQMGPHMWQSLTRGARWACVALLVLIVGAAVPPLAARLTHGGAIEHSQSFRVRTWAGTVRMAEARPVTGFGGGTFEYAYPKFAEVGFTRAAHQIYLQFAAEQGLVGLVLFVAALLTALFRRHPRDERITAIVAMRAALVAVAVHGFFDYGWQIPALALWTAGLIGALSAVPPAAPVRRRRFGAAPFAAVAAAAVALALLLPEWLSAREVAAADSALHHGSLTAAAGHYVKALRWSPRNEGTRLDYAGLLVSLAAHSQSGGRDLLDEAERQYRLAVRQAPTHAAALRRLGEFYVQRGQQVEAAKWFRRAVAAFPNYTAAHFSLAECERSLGYPESAEKAYRRVLAIAAGPAGQLQAVPELAFDPAVAQAALRLADMLHDRKECPASLAAARRGLAEMARYRRSEAYQATLARAGGLAAPLPPAEADLLEAELEVFAAAGEWQCGSREAFREAVESLRELEDSMLPQLWSKLPPKAAQEVE